MIDVALLCLASFFAGFIDSIVGGGGLILIPAFLIIRPDFALPLILGTNKFAACCGTTMATLQYARNIEIPWGLVLPVAAAGFACSFIGSYVVTIVSPAYLKPLIVALLVVVAIYTFVRKDFGAHHAPRNTGRKRIFIGITIGGAIGFYDGFFGPGTGSFLIFMFTTMLGFALLQSSASAKVVNLATNLASVLLFASTSNIDYGLAIPLAGFNILGAVAGSRLAMLKGNRFIRRFFLAVLALLIARLAWDLVR